MIDNYNIQYKLNKKDNNRNVQSNSNNDYVFWLKILVKKIQYFEWILIFVYNINICFTKHVKIIK